MATTVRRSEGYYTEASTDGHTNWTLLNQGPNDVYVNTVDRWPSLRRKKPDGIELLFAGQPYRNTQLLWNCPTVSFQSKTKIAGSYYRGKRSMYGTMPSLAQTEFERRYPYMYQVPKFEHPDELSSNDLRNLLGDQKLDLLTNVAQWKQTRDLFLGLTRPLIRDTNEYAQGVQKVIRRYNRVGWGIPGTALTKRLADLHLAYVFGVRPLVSEMCGAFELLTESDPKPVAKGRMATGPRLQLFAKSFAGSLYSLTDVTYVVREGYARRRYIVYGELGPVTDWRSYARIGINPLYTLWDTLPWSFAIDRFVQVGDALQAMTALNGIKRAQAYGTISVEMLTRGTNMHGEATQLERLTQRSLPSLTWTMPVVANTFTDKQVPTYTALLRQQFTKLSPLFR